MKQKYESKLTGIDIKYPDKSLEEKVYQLLSVWIACHVLEGVWSWTREFNLIITNLYTY